VCPTAKTCMELPPHHEMGPFIVPPTWDKGSGNQAISEIWAAAHRELAQAHPWIIIGYSAPPSDRFFQYLLGSARAENEHLETVAGFNYAPEDAGKRAIQERYERLFTRSFVDRRLQFFLASKFPGGAMNVLEALVNGNGGEALGWSTQRAGAQATGSGGELVEPAER
jgi:hypothetical protein